MSDGLSAVPLKRRASRRARGWPGSFGAAVLLALGMAVGGFGVSAVVAPGFASVCSSSWSAEPVGQLRSTSGTEVFSTADRLAFNVSRLCPQQRSLALDSMTAMASLPKTGYFCFTWASSVQSYTTGLLRLVNLAQLNQIIAAETPESETPTVPVSDPQVGVAVPENSTPPAPIAPDTEPAPQAPKPHPAPDADPAPAPTSAPAEPPNEAPRHNPNPSSNLIVQIIPGDKAGKSSAGVNPDAPATPAPAASAANQPAAGQSPQFSYADRSGLRPGTQASGAAASDAPASSSPSAEPGSKPTTLPTAPVPSGDQLTKDNAGSVSGGRQGNEVTLYLPSDAVKPKEWVSVFTYPGAQGTDWLEVSNERSVIINIASMQTGSYKLAVANSAGTLIGWAQLEISEENQAHDENAIAPVVGTAESDSGMDGGDWLLLGAAGVLVAGAAGFIFLTRPRTISGI
ncbi:hypothetical protein [Actinomyces trachealis]|uniref:hypothetical protein n=1 Tax=Actinomyces trachealis TaxID=2763540 RepID=UPI001892B64D|nr:hypothetical protein [Actinomyces trachealis]